MRIQFQIILFIICLNVATGLVMNLALPGSAYSYAPGSGSNGSELEDRWNSTALADEWQANPFEGIPVVGDIFRAFYLFFNMIRYVIDGFPMLLQWISDAYITDAAARTAFVTISYALRGIFAVMMSIMVIEFISGRRMPD